MKGIDIVTLHLKQGQTINLQEVSYVPNLKKNLVSISTMEDKGFKVEFIDGKVHIWKINLKYEFTYEFGVEGLYQVRGSPLGALLVILLFNLNYGTEDLLTFILNPYPMKGRWSQGCSDST